MNFFLSIELEYRSTTVAPPVTLNGGGYSTMMCGADRSTATVATTVNRVNIIKQKRSTTIAANFQSLMRSAFSSACRIRPEMNCSSRKMSCSSRCDDEQVPTCDTASSSVDADMPCRKAPPPPICRKSSSMSSTLASKLLDERSLSSSSFFCLCILIVRSVIFFPGRLIRRNHGNQCRSTVFTCGKEK
jgi:hypothetical protein